MPPQRLRPSRGAESLSVEYVSVSDHRGTLRDKKTLSSRTGIRKRTLLGPYSRTLPRVLGGS